METLMILACIGVIIADIFVIVTVLNQWKKGGK